MVWERDKRRLRAALRMTLRSLPEGAAHAAGEAIADHLRSWEGWPQITELALFSSLGDEIDTWPLMEKGRASGKPILLPRMTESHRLEFALVEDFDRLREGRYGVREPGAECPARRPAAGGLVLVPGLAFDREGGRLGRGGGFYDRTLARIDRERRRPVLLGAGFAVQIVERVPMESHDVRVDGLLTEDGIVWLEGRASGKPGRAD